MDNAFDIINKRFQGLENLALSSPEERKSAEDIRSSMKYEVAILKDNKSRLKLKQKQYLEAETLAKDALKVLIDGLLNKVCFFFFF